MRQGQRHGNNHNKGLNYLQTDFFIHDTSKIVKQTPK